MSLIGTKCPQFGRGFDEAFRSSGAIASPVDMAHVGVGVPLPQVTFYLRHAPLIMCSVWLEEGLSACERLVTVWRVLKCVIGK